MYVDEPTRSFRRFFYSVRLRNLCDEPSAGVKFTSRFIWFIKNGGFCMNEKWSRPKVAELDENVAALRRMRVIAWLALVFLIGGLCLWAGLFIGKIGG